MKENVAEFLEFRFEKLKLLKRSDKGEVWLASSKVNGELVIIKRVSLTGLPYDMLKKFSFKLPAKIFFCAEDESETVVVEEFIQGENLFERLEQKNFLSEAQAREILLQMCDGLKELHEQKIIHRDIKPSNLIWQGERIRLIDFDAARIFKEDKEVDTKLLGTRGYAPPEQFGHGQSDSRSDIYSLGVTIKILLGSNFGESLKKILDKCTELDPKNRFQSVDELEEALTTERLDEPEKELTPGESRRALFFLAIRVLLFMIRREFRAELIFLTIVIFLLASSTTLNSGENFSEEVETHAEKIIVEEITVPEENSQPAQVETFKFPEIKLPPSDNTPLPSLPKPLRNEPSQKNFSGQLKTEFYLNGVLFNQDERKNDREKITRVEWQRTQARLRITNDTGELWQNPTIKFRFGVNWGGDPVTDIKSLPTLNVGDSAEFIISFDSYELPDKENLAANIQIYLQGDESKMDEHYWCVWFDIAD